MSDLFGKALDLTKKEQPVVPTLPPTQIPPATMMLKLSNGDTIIAKVIGDPKDEPEKLIIADPFQIKTIHTPIEGGTRAVTFYTEWFINTENNVYLLAKNSIISAGTPNAAVRAEYAAMIAKKNIAIASTSSLEKLPETVGIVGATIQQPQSPPKKDWSLIDIDQKDRWKHS